MPINFWNFRRRQVQASSRRKPRAVSIEALEDRVLLASWSGDLPDGTHWTNSEVQILTDDVNVPAGATLTIDPGTVIKFANFNVDMTVNGKVLAQGTAGAPITFTEFRDDVGGDTNGDGSNSVPSNGFWGQILFQNGSTGNILDHVNIRYGGNSDAALKVDGAGLTLTNSTVAYSYTVGLRIQNSSPVLSQNVFQGSFGAAVSADLASQLVSSGSTVSGNAINGITLDVGTLAGNTTWNTPDLTLYMPGTITVPVGSTLTMEAGQVLKPGVSGTNNIIVNGTLLAHGTSASPVVFTSPYDRTAGGDLLNLPASVGSAGDWGHIEFNSTSVGNVLDHTKILFGGYHSPAEVLLDGGPLELTNSEIRASTNVGIRIQDSDPIFTNVVFQDNLVAASMDLISNPTFTSVTLANNGLNGLSVDGGNLMEDSIWNDPEITYLLAATVVVPANKSLTIGAGQVIKMEYSGTTDLIVAGVLNAVGTADHPIVVTSENDDSAGGDIDNNGVTVGGQGDWGHIEFTNSSTQSVLDHFEVRSGGFAAPGEIYVNAGKVAIRNGIVRDSTSFGVRIEASQPVINGVSFQNNYQAAISSDLASNPAISAVTFNSNAVNGVRLDGGTLTANGFWDDPDITYFLPSTITVPDSLTLTIGAGQIIKMSYSGTTDLVVNGALVANGTAAQPIFVTSQRDDSLGTDIDNNGASTPSGNNWGHIEFTNATRPSTLSHVNVSYGGFGASGLVVDRGGLLTIQDSTIRNSGTGGLSVIGAAPSLMHVTVQNNVQTAIFLDANSSILGRDLTATGNQKNLILIGAGTFTSNQTWDASGLDFQLDDSITIPAGLSLTLGAESIFNAQDSTKILGAGTILNSGTIRKTAGTGTSTISPHLINTGIVVAQSGTLSLSGGIENNGSGTIDGSTSAILSTQQNLTGDATIPLAGVVQPQVVFNGAGNAAQPQLLEAFSADLGNKDTGFKHNFGFGSLQVAGGTFVKLVDSHDNSNGSGAEAVYVDNLNVASGGTLNLNGLHLYARSTIINGVVQGGAVTILPDGGALLLNAPTPGKIGSVGEFDDWTFFGRSGQTVTITLSTGTSGANPVTLPSLNFGQLQLVDSSNNVLGTVASTASGADLQLTGITLPADGTYHIHVQAAPSQSSQTGNYVVGAFDATIRTSPAELNQTITGQIDNPFRIDRWTFAALAGQIITFDVVNTQNSSVQFDLTGPNEFTAFTGQNTDKEFMTLPAAGTYTLTVHTVQQQTGAYAFQLKSVSVNALALGGTFTGPIAGKGQAQIFKVNVPQLQQLQVQLSDTSASDRNEVYVSFGSTPTRSDYQYKYNTPASANQLLTIPSAAPGDWYVLVYTEAAPQPGTITLQVKGGSLFVNDVTPDHSGNGADQVLTLTGVGFDNTTAVSLVSASNVVFNANSVRLDQPTQVTATFNAGTVPAGTYYVRVTKSGGGISTLTNAFTVSAGGVAHLETKVIVPNPIGLHISSTFYVQYTNSGTVAMEAPLLVLTGVQNGKQGALLTLDPALQVSGFWTSATPAGYSQSVQFLASGAIPGILGPGETASVPVYYAGWLTSQWDFSRPPIFFNLGTLTSDSADVVDWASMKSSLQPDNISDRAWDGIYPNLISQLGSTWGSVIQHLDQDAEYLGSLGQRVTDLSSLWSFEIQIANGINPYSTLGAGIDMVDIAPGMSLSASRIFGSTIGDRSLTGIFGNGWQFDGGWMATLDVAVDGTVMITDGTSVRQFQPDSRNGSYFSQIGDRGILAKLSSTAYTLTDPNGLVTRFDNGVVSLKSDPNGNTISTAYTNGRLTSLTASAGQSITFAYNGAGHVTGLTNSSGETAHYTYDATNQYLLSVTDFNGYTTNYTYNMGTGPSTNNALRSISDQHSAQQLFDYDNQGRLITASATGGVLASHYGYGASGIVTSTNPTNDTTTYYYDARGLLAKIVNPLQQSTFYSYNNKGNLLSVTNPAGSNYSYAYDAQGRAIQVTNPLGNVTRLTYGNYDRVTSITDPNGNKTSHQFDTKGNITSQTFADGTIESLAYDPIGQITQTIDGNNTIVNYTYNAKGYITKKIYADNSQVTYGYDALDNLSSITNSNGVTTLEYDASHLLSQVTYPDGKFLKYSYDAQGHRTQMQDQTGYLVKYNFDSLGRLSGLSDAADQPIVTYTYNPNGQLQQAVKANGTSTQYSYDKVGRFLSIVNLAPGGATNSSFVYTYDNQGLCQTETTLQGQWVYTYDAVGQLIHAVFTSNNPGQAPNQDLQYFYDAAGNRTRSIENGITTTYTVNSRNEYSSAGSTAYVYDAVGNMISSTDASGTTQYTYDNDDLLTAIQRSNGPDTTYTYDAFGQISAITQAGQQTQNLVDPTSKLLFGQFDSGGATLNHYNFGIGLVNQVNANGSSKFYDFDVRGSVIGLTNASGAYANTLTYSPFGSVLSTTGTGSNPFQFVGQWGVTALSSTQSLMGERAYDATLGAFLEEDPTGRLGGDFNLHRYANNNPVGQIDPIGLASSTPQAKVATNTSSFDYRGAAEEKEREKNAVILTALARTNSVLEQLVAKHKITPAQQEKALEIIGFYLMTSNGEILHEERQKNPVVTSSNDADPTRNYISAIGLVGVFGAPVIGAGAPSPTSPGDDTEGPVSEPPADVTYEVPDREPPLPEPPAEAQEPVQTASTNTHDPNDLIGPAGFGPQGFIANDIQELPYRIDFENSPTAFDAVQRVVVMNQLDPDLDWITFALTGAGFGDIVVSIPPGSQYYKTTVPMTYNGISFVVELTLGIHSDSGQVYATFQALDPETSLPPSATTGFLPPEDETGRGTGFLTYVVKSKAGLTTGVQIPNIATIYFDTNAAITTDQIDTNDPSKGFDPAKRALVTMDAAGPGSSVTALPAQSQASFVVSWTGADDANGSGIASFDIYASVDGGDFTIWQSATSATSATYAGGVNHTYRFYSIARDNVGHVEAAPATADAVTQVPVPPPVVVNQSFNVPENSAANTTIGTVLVQSSSGLGSLVFSITGGNSAGLFTIDPATGVLQVATGANLNFEATSTYTLTVQVSDTAGPSLMSSAQMTVHVTDVNEHPAIGSGQTFNVSGSATVNTVVGTVTATDPDTTVPNSSRNFSIVDGTGAFAISPQTGQITVANGAALTAVAGQAITLQVTDTDGGNPALSATQTVTINVGPANTAPVLATPGPEATYFGNLKTAVKVTPTLTVTDADGPATLSTIKITLIGGPAKKNPDIINLPGVSAIGVASKTVVGAVIDYTITLNAGVTNAAVQSFLQGVTFQTKGTGLKPQLRQFQVQVTDTTGLQSNLIAQLVHVQKKAPKIHKP